MLFVTTIDGPIPIIGEVTSAAELVSVLKRAHADTLSLAEHELHGDDRFVVVQP